MIQNQRNSNYAVAAHGFIHREHIEGIRLHKEERGRKNPYSIPMNTEEGAYLLSHLYD